ncbi:chromosome partitioning protein ParB [Pediococcus stilesii]|uniref:Chromosome partitioning protein ParB n=1 Tax=Pediococcus stilesii TaxID=331679 RepID=A0A5R9BY86_9LACO|nr:ParB N-terminal domain-containing protein [Pediococcus stilesii]TLQ05465.1 chromosome partitioning protein ParB [Pediococcus stilesii]
MALEIKEVPITQITPYENNPRNNDEAVEATANSIKEFGWQQPIVVDKDGVIIVGHTRLKAAKQLGLKNVPVIYADGLNEEQVTAYRLADNKTGELADWDFDKSEEELNNIVDIDMSEFEFENFEFSEGDVNLDDYEEPDDGSTKLQLKWAGHSINLTGEELHKLDSMYDAYESSGENSFVDFLESQVFRDEDIS